MTTQIAIIDPFMKSPSIHCFNGLVKLLGLRSTYHQPSVFGVDSLLQESSHNSAYIVLGSASHVHEKLSWHAPLANFLTAELKLGKPVLGCCFGHQLLCHAFGSEIEFHSPDESKHEGVREIKISEDFWNFKKGEVFNLAVTHRQVVTKLGKELQFVGGGLLNDLVIHRHLPFMGTQAHPEASEHFCTTDIQNLPPAQILFANTDGGRLIRRFFQHFRLI